MIEMCPFRWFRGFDEYDQRQFQASLEVIDGKEPNTFTVMLSWIDKNKQSGEIFVPVEGIELIHSKILEFKQKGLKEELGQQVYPSG